MIYTRSQVTKEKPMVQDIVDQVFDRVDSLYNKGSKVVSSVQDAVSNTVSQIGGDTQWEAELAARSREEAGSPILRSFSSLGSAIYRQLSGKMVIGCGFSAVMAVLFWRKEKLLGLPEHLPKNQPKCCLVLGDMHDPIIRSQVMDLYRRRFTIFVCSRDAPSYREHEEDDDFLVHLDPTSSSDLANFVQSLNSTYELASILFMPNLSYHPSGEMSLSQLETEIRSNTLLYFYTLMKLLPHLPRTQVILFDPSLTYNMKVPHHPVEIIVSGIVKSVYQSLARHKKLDLYLVHLGILQLTAQPSNYKFLNLKGSNINTALLEPVYRLVMAYNGNILRRMWLWIVTLGSLNHHLYCGKYSWISTFPLITPLIKKWI
ncbi:hypothetical protein ZYGR_0AV00300 [Zygosaccharomyces rouxii]|uniref:Uncharacterized protein n=1 Tax=Zygosaccharomyces rouxii TaxID=4956 RepID=A0A1Q3AI43_ZYGRO|nr:hypothetical protein ZYGR_0AV00300 [Zygosaccharomyces rouxii]